jgi:hypothetical protein
LSAASGGAPPPALSSSSSSSSYPASPTSSADIASRIALIARALGEPNPGENFNSSSSSSSGSGSREQQHSPHRLSSPFSSVAQQQPQQPQQQASSGAAGALMSGLPAGISRATLEHYLRARGEGGGWGRGGGECPHQWGWGSGGRPGGKAGQHHGANVP